MGAETSLDAAGIKEIIPHRKPFRFIDTITGVEFGRRAVAPLADLMQPELDWIHPQLLHSGTLPLPIIIEALAEVGAVAVLGLPQNKGKIGMLVGVSFSFTSDPIRTDEQVILNVEVTNLRSNFGRAKCQAIVKGEVRAEGNFSFGAASIT